MATGSISAIIVTMKKPSKSTSTSREICTYTRGRGSLRRLYRTIRTDYRESLECAIGGYRSERRRDPSCDGRTALAMALYGASDRGVRAAICRYGGCQTRFGRDQLHGG